jgi:hypothetical protein
MVLWKLIIITSQLGLHLCVHIGSIPQFSCLSKRPDQVAIPIMPSRKKFQYAVYWESSMIDNFWYVLLHCDYVVRKFKETQVLDTIAKILVVEISACGLYYPAGSALTKELSSRAQSFSCIVWSHFSGFIFFLILTHNWYSISQNNSNKQACLLMPPSTAGTKSETSTVHLFGGA